MGCNRSVSTRDVEEAEPEARPSLIAEAEREYDFGDVIASPGRRLEHRYRLTNATPRDVKILKVINRKTCCGIVRLEPEEATLRPGAARDVEVTLSVGDRFGQVTHEAEIITDWPPEPSPVLRTTAGAVPPVRVEEDSAPPRTILIGSKEPQQAIFCLYASGTSSEPPIDLDRLELRSAIKVGWEGPKKSSPSDGELRVEWRRLTATLAPDGPPGERREEIQFRQGGTIVGRHPVSWEVASPIAISPRMIAMRSGQREYRVAVQSRDRRPFRITRIQCDVPGIEVRASSSTAAVTQIVQIDGFPHSRSGRGAIALSTDHPIQRNVDVPFVIVD